MRWVWRFIYVWVTIQYTANFLGFVFDDWRLDTFDVAFACFVVVLWAAEQMLHRERELLEGE